MHGLARVGALHQLAELLGVNLFDAHRRLLHRRKARRGAPEARRRRRHPYSQLPGLVFVLAERRSPRRGQTPRAGRTHRACGGGWHRDAGHGHVGRVGEGARQGGEVGVLVVGVRAPRAGGASAVLLTPPPSALPRGVRGLVHAVVVVVQAVAIIAVVFIGSCGHGSDGLQVRLSLHATGLLLLCQTALLLCRGGALPFERRLPLHRHEPFLRRQRRQHVQRAVEGPRADVAATKQVLHAVRNGTTHTLAAREADGVVHQHLLHDPPHGPRWLRRQSCEYCPAAAVGVAGAMPHCLVREDNVGLGVVLRPPSVRAETHVGGVALVLAARGVAQPAAPQHEHLEAVVRLRSGERRSHVRLHTLDGAAQPHDGLPPELMGLRRKLKRRDGVAPVRVRHAAEAAHHVQTAAVEEPAVARPVAEARPRLDAAPRVVRR
eukprot:PhM_4_TR12922/c2_g1_i1/m.2508